MCNRVSSIIELIDSEHWRHVSGVENPADCASRGLFPSEILHHALWWKGPDWIKASPLNYPHREQLPATLVLEEIKEVSLHTITENKQPVIDPDHYSSYTQLTHITAWMQRFVHNCAAKMRGQPVETSQHLLVRELQLAKAYWYHVIQEQHFEREISALQNGQNLLHPSPLIPLHPIFDQN